MDNAGARVQADLIGVDSNLFGTHSGGWVNGWFRGELVNHNAGVFRLEPGLIWGNQQSSPICRAPITGPTTRPSNGSGTGR